MLGFEDNLIVDLIYTVTDCDGQIATGTLAVDFDDDMPRVNGAVESRIVDEDDIETDWSTGHEPKRRRCRRFLDHREPVPAPRSCPARRPAWSTSAPTRYPEGDEEPPSEDTPAAIIGSGMIFGFTADVIAQMEALGLHSKQSVQPATENGLPLFYTTFTDGDWHVLAGFEPDPDVGCPGGGHNADLGDTGNPVFELRVNQITGEYEFRLFDELIHRLPPGFPERLRREFRPASGEPDPVTGRRSSPASTSARSSRSPTMTATAATLDGKFDDPDPRRRSGSGHRRESARYRAARRDPRSAGRQLLRIAGRSVRQRHQLVQRQGAVCRRWKPAATSATILMFPATPTARWPATVRSAMRAAFFRSFLAYWAPRLAPTSRPPE